MVFIMKVVFGYLGAPKKAQKNLASPRQANDGSALASTVLARVSLIMQNYKIMLSL